MAPSLFVRACASEIGERPVAWAQDIFIDRRMVAGAAQ